MCGRAKSKPKPVWETPAEYKKGERRAEQGGGSEGAPLSDHKHKKSESAGAAGSSRTLQPTEDHMEQQQQVAMP